MRRLNCSMKKLFLFRFLIFMISSFILLPAFSLASGSPVSFRFMAPSVSEPGDPQVLTALKQEIQNFPDSAPLRRDLGEFYLKSGEYKEAEQAFQTAITLNSSDLKSRYDLGLAYENAKDYQEARKIYLQTLYWNEQHLDYKIGICYLDMKKYRRASYSLSKALKLENTAKINYAMALALAGQRDYSGALQALKVARQKDPDFREWKKFFGSRDFLWKKEDRWEEKVHEKLFIWIGVCFSVFWILLFIYFREKFFFFRKEEEEEY